MKEKSRTKVRWSQQSIKKMCALGIPWWLAHEAFTARGLGSIPGWGIKILQAPPVPKKKKEKENASLEVPFDPHRYRSHLERNLFSYVSVLFSKSHSN